MAKSLQRLIALIIVGLSALVVVIAMSLAFSERTRTALVTIIRSPVKLGKLVKARWEQHTDKKNASAPDKDSKPNDPPTPKWNHGKQSIPETLVPVAGPQRAEKAAVSRFSFRNRSSMRGRGGDVVIDVEGGGSV